MGDGENHDEGQPPAQTLGVVSTEVLKTVAAYLAAMPSTCIVPGCRAPGTVEIKTPFMQGVIYSLMCERHAAEHGADGRQP